MKIYGKTSKWDDSFSSVELGNDEVREKFSELQARMGSGELNGKRVICDCVGTLYEYNGLVRFVPSDASFTVE